MLRISKIADYGTKVLLAMVEKPTYLYSSAELAECTHVNQPTVSKILKLLTKGGVLTSKQGSQGGYQLARDADNINLAEVVGILDGEIAMTECDKHMGCCDMEADCSVKDNWSVISSVIHDVLQNISLQQMLQPILPKEIPVKFYKRELA